MTNYTADQLANLANVYRRFRLADTADILADYAVLLRESESAKPIAYADEHNRYTWWNEDGETSLSIRERGFTPLFKDYVAVPEPHAQPAVRVDAVDALIRAARAVAESLTTEPEEGTALSQLDAALALIDADLEKGDGHAN